MTGLMLKSKSLRQVCANLRYRDELRSVRGRRDCFRQTLSPRADIASGREVVPIPSIKEALVKAEIYLKVLYKEFKKS